MGRLVLAQRVTRIELRTSTLITAPEASAPLPLPVCPGSVPWTTLGHLTDGDSPFGISQKVTHDTIRRTTTF